MPEDAATKVRGGEKAIFPWVVKRGGSMVNGPDEGSGHCPKIILSNAGPYDRQVVSSGPEDDEDGPEDADDGVS
jgi:hypothetical protein